MKTGLVLEGGALRTIYSSGVTDGFLEMGLEFDYTVGVSAGIAYGVSFLSRQFGRNLDLLTRHANDPRYMSFRNMLRPGNRRCYFGLDFSYVEIPQKLIPFDYGTFAQCRGDAEAVVTDLETGKAVYVPLDFNDPNTNLLQATCAMPLLFPIFDVNGIKCMDGGAADAIPWQRAFDVGCDKIVVVLTKERSYRRTPEKLEPLIDRVYRKYPNFLRTLHDRADNYNRNREELFEAEAAGKVFIFAPDNTKGFSRTERDVEKIKAHWQHGLNHARAQKDALMRFLDK